MTAPPLQKALGIKSQDKIKESYGAFSRAWERKAWRIAPERIIGKEKKKVMKELYELMKKALPGAAFDMETDLNCGQNTRFSRYDSFWWWRSKKNST